MSQEKHFDVEKIVGIKIVSERDGGFTWREFQPKRSIFFGLFRYPSKPAGWYDESSWQEIGYTEEQLCNDYNYVMYEGKPHYRPYVTVYLEHGYEVTKNFDKLSQAQHWVNELKAWNKKDFEIVRYE